MPEDGTGAGPAAGASAAGKGRPTISTHVLDTATGKPASGVHVTLYRLADDGRPLRLTQALTDDDGRVRDLLERPLVAGTYRLDVALAGREGFLERVAVDFRVDSVDRSWHVPVLISPSSATTYRGS